MKKIILQFFLLAIHLTIRGEISSCHENEGKPWNFVLILLDDAGWKDLGFTGNNYIETPHLDGIAKRGVQFANAYATHPFSSPTRQSIMTGQFPARTAWVKKSELESEPDQIVAPSYSPAGSHKWTKMEPEFNGLALMLKSKGYATGHIGKWHFGLHESDITPEKLGFDFNFGGHPMVGAVKNHFAPFEGLPGDVTSSPGEYLTDRLTNETISFIEKNKDKPFYVQLWHYAPHEPIMAPKHLVDKYTKKMLQHGYDNVNPTYAAMIDAIDQGVGKILSKLKELNIDDRTIIIIASDNGGVKQFGSVPVTSMYPLRGEKGLIYEGGIRVPMAIYVPGNTQPGIESDEFVSVIDLYPTILDFAGVEVKDDQILDGFSLRPLLNGEQQNELNERIHLWYNPTHGIKDHNGEIFQPVAVIQKNQWKLIKKFNHGEELYNLKTDPSESHNLATFLPHITQRMSFMLDSCLSTTEIALPKPNPNFDNNYLIAIQTPNSLVDHLRLKTVYSWNWEALSDWGVNNAVKATREADCLRMHPLTLGAYPKITSGKLENTPSGVYIVKIVLRTTAQGSRIRFDWKDEKQANGVIEIFPERDGDWETVTGIFKSSAPIQSIGLAGPTHLGKLGFYNEEVNSGYIDVKTIELFKIE